LGGGGGGGGGGELLPGEVLQRHTPKTL
jgi:hypothetical protein